MAVCTFFVFSFGAEYVLVDSVSRKLCGKQFNFSYCSSSWKINFFLKKKKSFYMLQLTIHDLNSLFKACLSIKS